MRVAICGCAVDSMLNGSTADLSSSAKCEGVVYVAIVPTAQKTHYLLR
jgi:hypothetical protein